MAVSPSTSCYWSSNHLPKATELSPHLLGTPGKPWGPHLNPPSVWHLRA